MSATLSLSARNHRGPGKPFVARIIGTDPKFGFDREFLPNPYVADEPGLYQTRSNGDTFYVLVSDASATTDESTAHKIAKRLGAGEAIESFVEILDDDVRLLSAAAARKAAAAASEAEASDACWAVIERLTDGQKKAVLRTLRARISPPAPSAPAVPVVEPAVEQTPAMVASD